MSETFPPTPDELLETFELLFDWEEKYEYLIELGKKLPELPEPLRQEENRVHGCMSTVWLVSEFDQATPPHLYLQADSDSLIVRGLIAALLGYYQGKDAETILKSDPDQWFGELGFQQSLSANRRNGLAAMIQRIKSDALAATAQQRS